MHITWHGFSCIKIQTQDSILLLNPYQDSGISMPKLKADIVVMTDPNNEQCNNVTRLQGEPIIVSNAGEYEIQNIFIYGLPAAKQQTLYVLEAEGMKIAHLGTSLTSLSNEQLEVMEGIDVLFLPIHGSNAAQRSDVISAIEPRVIIPIQYQTPKVKPPLDSIDVFIKEMGVKDSVGDKKVILKAKELPAEETQTIILQAS